MTYRLVSRCRGRNQRGSLGTVLFAAAMLIVIIICSLAVDTAQTTYIRCQLRSVADAAAIAGAQDLSTDVTKCETHALAVANENLKNCLQIEPGSGTTAISTVVTPPSNGSLGVVRVTLRMTVSHVMLSIINRPFDTVQVVAVAGGLGRITRHSGFKLFPLAVSIDALPGNGSNAAGNGKGVGVGAAGNGGSGGGSGSGSSSSNGNNGKAASSGSSSSSNSSNGNNGKAASSGSSSGSSGGATITTTTTTTSGGDGTGSGANGGTTVSIWRIVVPDKLITI